MIFITLPSRIIRPHEVEANASKLVGVLTIYKIVFIYIYIYIYIYSAFVGLDYTLYKMHGTYIKIMNFYLFYCLLLISALGETINRQII